ncbi:MAG TPA: oligosaccharide flippase family protein [Planctomycetota bacterium]|nr:oligosaccharide flippase family protein [Planctomycetota bacterium]
MSRHVQRTLTALGAGAILQRGALLAVSVVLGHALGPAGFGRYALATALGTTIAALAGTGIRSVTSRAIAREPLAAGGWIRAAVRLRLLATALLLPFAFAAIGGLADDPWPWWLGALLAVPLAWDQKGLLDAAARTAREVLQDLVATAVHVLGILGLLALGVTDLTTLVAAQLAGRAVYAVGAELTMRSLPGFAAPPSARAILPHAFVPTVTQTLAGLAQNGDVWLVRWFGGEAAAGLYAVAVRVATTAALPAAQLARLLQPHNDRAAATTAAAGTAVRSLRATAYAILPIAAGGAVVAEPLCALFGREFGATAPALRTLLAATVLQQFGWIQAQVLFAHMRMRAWAVSLWAGTAAQVAAIALLTPRFGATGAAAGALCGYGLHLAAATTAVNRRLPIAMLRALLPGGAIAAATASAALLATPWHLVAQLAAGGAALATCLYFVELRHTWRHLGAGLSGASGFGT